MVKKINKKRRSIAELREAYKGSTSTIIITLFIIGFGLFLPMLSANNVEKARDGKGFYSPREVNIWDLNGQSDYAEVQYTSSGDEHGSTRSSVTNEQYVRVSPTSSIWSYHYVRGSSRGNVRQDISRFTSIVDLPKENMVEGYGTYLFNPIAKDNSNVVYDYTYPGIVPHKNEDVRLYFDIDVKTLIDNEAIRIDFIAEYDESKMLYTGGGKVSVTIEYRTENVAYVLVNSDHVNWVMGEIYSLDIEIEDLITIGSLVNSQEQYLYVDIRVRALEDGFNPGTTLFYDLQVVGLVSKTNSIAILSVWNVVHSITMILMGLIMLPQFSFGGLAKRLSLSKGSN